MGGYRTMAKIYVSSTFLDLQECRKKIELTIRQMGHEDVAMEYYVAENRRPVEKCLADVASCDLYLGIFAWRYGYIPKKKNRQKLSITEMEYRQAQKTSKPCLIFLLDGKAPWPPDFIDDDKSRIKKIRSELSESHNPGYFKSVENISSIVAPALHKWEQEHGHIVSSTLGLELDVNAYFSALKKRYQRLDLDALTPPQREDYLKLQLRSVFVEQNVRESPPPVELPKELWTKLEHEQKFQGEDLYDSVTIDAENIQRVREIYFEKPSLPVLQSLSDSNNQHVIILGDPGSGKSTLARYLLLSLIEPTSDGKLTNTFSDYLPLLIELRSYNGLRADKKCDTFLEYCEYMGKTEGWGLTRSALNNYLQNDGRAVIIFDGLDEIFDPEEREQLTRQIVGFASDYPKTRIIATSRIIGYRKSILSDAGFTHFTLQDLNGKQVVAFVERWYKLALSDRPEEARERQKRIMQSFRESAPIRQLAGNPMLLTIMTIIGKHQELPQERWKLYDHAASVLIQHWDINKHLKDRRVKADFIGEDDKKELLRRLAYKMQGSEGGLAGNYIHYDELQAEFEGYLKERYGQPPDRAKVIADVMIQQFRERNFILSLYGANVYGFVHRAFLEYFCASAFVHKFEKTKELTIESLKQDIFGAHWQDQNWHEVLRLICGMIDEKFAGEITDYLVEEVYNPWPGDFGEKLPWNIALAVKCFGELRKPSVIAESSKRLLHKLCLLFDYEMMGKRRLISFFRDHILPTVETIGAKWPHRSVLSEWLKNRGSFSYAWLYNDILGRFIGIMGRGVDEVHKIVLNYAKHYNKNYRILVPFALATGWPKHQKTLLLLHDLADNDKDEFVRSTACLVLARYFTNDQQTLTIIRDRITNDSHERVRSDAVRALARH